MKVAVSIPDDVFNEAETLARELQTSRSEVYARALAAFVDDHAPDRVTSSMNQVVDALGDKAIDVAVDVAARRILNQVEW